MLRAAVATILAIAVPAGAVAQSSATTTLTVQATIVPEALQIVASQTLDFGVVVPGVPTTVNARTGANAGQFELRGHPRAEFTATFTLPAALTLGPHSMPIAFGAQSGCQDRDGNGNCAFFDPRAPFTGRIANKVAPQNTFYFRIGGTVTPAVGQQPGTYRGTIALHVAYTGN